MENPSGSATWLWLDDVFMVVRSVGMLEWCGWCASQSLNRHRGIRYAHAKVGGTRYAHVRVGCTWRTRRSPAPVREAGAHPQAHAKVACTRTRSLRAPAREAGAHPHAKLARTRTLMATDLLLRVARPVGIGALVDRLRSVPVAPARALLDPLKRYTSCRFCFCGSKGNLE